MKLLFYITIIGFLCLSLEAVSQQCREDYFNNYKSFVARQQSYDSAKKLMRSGLYAEAISVYKPLLDDPDLRLPGRTKIAVCYYMLHQYRKAMEEIDKVILEGHPIEYIKSQKELNPIFPEIEKHYNKLRPKYLATIDLELRAELNRMEQDDQGIRHELHKPENYTKRKRDSIYSVMGVIDSVNLSKLKRIISIHGWPNPKIIGSNVTIYDIQHEIHLELFAMHNGEKENISLLQLALDEVCKGNENWFTVIPMVKNLLWRFNQDGYNKLRYTYVTDEGKIDWAKSYFQLKILSEFMHDNPDAKISLFIAKYNDEPNENLNKYIATLEEVRKFLVSEKVNPELIQIENEIKTVADDGMGKFRIAYKRYR